MAKRKKGFLGETVYQDLNSFFNMGAMADPTGEPSTPDTKPSRVLIKGTSPEEIQKRGVEFQQQKFLQDKFFRTTDRGFQKALQYEAARLPAYIDYEGMEYYPIISSALDLFMEESTTIGINGNMLNIHSNKQRIKSLLDEFFFDVINVNVNLPFWTRNTPVKWDSMIPLLDGTEITIKELSERLKTNPDKEIWTYSIQDNTKNIVPGKVIWCDLTRANTQIVRVNLDDNTYVETTPDHEFLLRNGKYVKASDLKSNDSLMPFYTIESKEGKYLKGYEKVYNPATNHHKFTHRLVSTELLRDIVKENKLDDRIVTHHKDFNKKNNHPSNLVRMTNVDHSKLHGKHASKILKRPDVVEKRMKGIDNYLRSNKRKKYLSNLMKGIYPRDFEKYNSSEQHVKHNKIRSKSMLKHWSDDTYKSKVKGLMQININDKLLKIIDSYLITSDTYLSKAGLCEKLINDKEFINIFKSINNVKRDLNKSLNTRTINSMILRKTGFDYVTYYSIINPEIKNDKQYVKTEKVRNTRIGNYPILNHKVISVEFLNNLEDVYCMEVVGPNGEHDRHNFPICSKNENGEYTRNGIFVSNCKYGDNFVLMYGEKKKGVTHVKQMVNYEIERFERIQDGKPTIRFKERMTGDEFNIFEVAHFRLLGDDKYLPYGSSMLNKIRRVFRQLIMAEDAMLTYRLVRAGEKKVFKIDVGNIDEDDIEDYVYKVASKFKKTQQTNPNDGQIDYRFNILGNDEDYFLPVRNANVQTGIDTLPGASNLSDIHDIEYLRDNLFMGLGIPKPFLSFQDAAGGGKNLAQFDIRFTKKVNRIQQAMIQELNKMAMIHLKLLGYSGDDLSDFSLTLTNPSMQNELVKAEVLREKAQTYTELTRSEGGIAAMSHTRAKSLVFNMSDGEIVDDLKQQKMEMAVKQELQDAPVIIKSTGLFKDIDDMYGEPLEGRPIAPEGEEGEAPAEAPPGAPPAEEPGAEAPGAAPGAPAETPEFPISERKSKRMSLENYMNHVNTLVYGDKKENDKTTTILLEEKNNNLNLRATKMINEIDGLLGEKLKDDTKNTQSLDLEDFDDVEVDD